MSHNYYRRYRLVKLSYPHENGGITSSITSFKIKNKNNTIYETVEEFEKEVGLKIKEVVKEVKEPVLLRDVINLHNSDGIKNMNQIRAMVKKIISGKDILSQNGFPNIKLVKTKQSEWVLFDGHHSLLSYMITGRKFLHEIPHIVVNNENGYVNDREILVFFGTHSNKLNDMNWRKHVINWQATEERQLSKREQKNMGELLDSILRTSF